MARYKDVDKLIAHLKDEIEGCKDKSCGTALGLKMAISFAETLPEEGVVPRAEVDVIKATLENEALKREKLAQILNSYALQYGTVKDQHEVIDKIKCETAKEIFAEIYEDCFDQFGYIDYDALIQLKKKYTGGE